MTLPRRPTLADFTPEGAPALTNARIAVDPATRRIAVRVASWDEVHSGFGEKVRMPRSVNVDAAHVGSATLNDGSNLRVATLPMDTVHAPHNMQAMHAASWYEQTGKGVARVRYSVDDTGIRADGVLFDDVDTAQLDRITAASASGDWRSAFAVKRYSDFEHTPADFVGSCIVNVPGFSDTFGKSRGERFALAASAHTIMLIEDEADMNPSLPATAAAPANPSPNPAAPPAPTLHTLAAAATDPVPAPGTTAPGASSTSCPPGCSTTEAGTCVCDEGTPNTTTDYAPAGALDSPVTLSASALSALTEAASSLDTPPSEAITEATQALTAAGHDPNPAPTVEDRLARIEALVASAVMTLMSDDSRS